MVEINETERKKEKRIKRCEDNLRDLWNNIKVPNIQIIGVPEEEDKKKRQRNIQQLKQYDKCPPDQTKGEIGSLPEK